MTAAPATRVGVVVMAYGTPARTSDIEAYYTHIRRGRPPSPEQLADLTRRYDALGGTSTLAARTADQVAAVARELDRLEPQRFEVRLGQKHASPFIEDAVSTLAAEGVGHVVGLVLAPHYSGASVGEYQNRAAAAAAQVDIGHSQVLRWYDEPTYQEFLATAVVDALTDMGPSTQVVFTAHSLPERVLEGDSYPGELAASAAAAARLAGLDASRWSLAWQSAGATPEPWRGPDILAVIDELARSGGTDGILVCPQGFVADHLEVAYDLDIEAAARASEAGLAFGRTRTLNDDPRVMAALARRVQTAANSPVAGQNAGQSADPGSDPGAGTDPHQPGTDASPT
ncbi:MAG: ferrochelatase [Acidimicrobiales bacterium]